MIQSAQRTKNDSSIKVTITGKVHNLNNKSENVIKIQARETKKKRATEEKNAEKHQCSNIIKNTNNGNNG